MEQVNVFKCFPINTVISWENKNEKILGIVTSYCYGSKKEILLECKEITFGIEEGRGESNKKYRLNPYNELIKVTTVVDGTYLY